MSGCAGVVVIHMDNRLFLSNVGDCKAIVFRKIETNP